MLGEPLGVATTCWRAVGDILVMNWNHWRTKSWDDSQIIGDYWWWLVISYWLFVDDWWNKSWDYWCWKKRIGSWWCWTTVDGRTNLGMLETSKIRSTRLGIHRESLMLARDCTRSEWALGSATAKIATKGGVTVLIWCCPYPHKINILSWSHLIYRNSSMISVFFGFRLKLKNAQNISKKITKKGWVDDQHPQQSVPFNWFFSFSDTVHVQKNQQKTKHDRSSW